MLAIEESSFYERTIAEVLAEFEVDATEFIFVKRGSQWYLQSKAAAVGRSWKDSRFEEWKLEVQLAVAQR